MSDQIRREHDFLGSEELPADALYGIHAYRAAGNFPGDTPFNLNWYRALGTVKHAAFRTIERFQKALNQEASDVSEMISMPDSTVLSALLQASEEVQRGDHFDHFIVPALQGGAGTSIHMNINEIIANRALQILGESPGRYSVVDPIESANLFQSTNDVVPTALKVAAMELLKVLEREINATRSQFEQLESTHRNALRTGYTQMQQAVPSTYGLLFSSYCDALSRDWWRVSKASERIKQINLGGGATGSAMGIPRFYLMNVVPQLREITGLPLAQAENMVDATSNLDSLVESHAILKAHAVNLEKIVGDLRLLSSDITGIPEISLPERQAGSSIMPGKVNPVIPEYIISAAHKIYSNDQCITSLSGLGILELNAYLPSIGEALLDTLENLIRINRSFRENMLKGLKVNEERAKENLLRSPSVATLLSTYIGYHKATELALLMKKENLTISEANKKLELIPSSQLDALLRPENLVKRGFSVEDLREFSKQRRV